MKFIRRIVLTMVIAYGLTLAANAENVSMKIYSVGENKCIDVENSFYKITIVPNGGGRIFKWLDKLNNTTLTDAPIPKNNHFSLGGMLDDRGKLTSTKYNYAADQISPEMVRVTLWANDSESKLEVAKTLTFKENSPVVNVHYKYSNNSQEVITGFKIGIRNFIHPSGGVISTEDRYFLPTTHGIRRIIGYDWENVTGGPMPELGSKLFRNLSAPWHGIINLRLKHGLGVSLNDDFYDGWYFWKPKVAKPTYEWTYKDLPAGHSRETSFDLTQLNGLSSLAYLSEKLAVDMRTSFEKLDMTIESRLRAFADIGGATLKTEVRLVTGKWNHADLKKIPSIAKGGEEAVRIKMRLPKKGLYEVTQTLTAGNLSATWRDAVPIGENTTTAPIFAMKYRAVSQPKPIPGWIGPEKVKFSPSAEAKKMGFAITSPIIDNRCVKLEKINFNIAKNEFESRELLFFPTRPNGPISVTLKNAALVNAKIRIENIIVVDAYKYGQGIVKAKILFDENSFNGDQKTSVWLTVGGRNLSPGRYDLEISFTGSDGRKKTLPVDVNVRDVSLPIRPLISLEAEGSPMSFPVGKDPKLLDYWLKDMSEHGIDFFQGTLIGPKIYSNLKLLGTNLQLSYDLQKRPEFYRAGKNLPELDFSYLDYYLDKAIANGLVRIKTHRYDISVPTALEKHVCAQAAKYLMSKGYQKKDMFVKILDEQPVDKFPAMAKTAKWLKECGFRPFSTFNCLLGYPDELKILSPYFDMYQGGFTNRKERLQRIAEGLLKPDDLVPNYTGFGTCLQTYETMLIHGLNTTALNQRMFHCHEYMRGGNGRLIANIIFIDENNKPCDSPSFEGLRDGMETANLWKLYLQWKTILGGEKSLSPLFAKLDSEFDRILGGSSPLLKITRTNTRGLVGEYIESTTFENYDKIHLILLDILDTLRKNTKAEVGLKYATVKWNNLILWNRAQTFSCKTAGEKTEERAAVQSFMEYLGDYSGISVSELKSGKTNASIIFELLKKSDTMPYTYQVHTEKNTIKVVAKTKKNLILAGKNLIRTMSVSGVWR